MTLYLWHIPPLLAMHLVFDYLGSPALRRSRSRLHRARHRRFGDHGDLVATVFVVLRPLENNPSAALGRRLRGRDWSAQCPVGALLCVAGAATLASVGWGLKDQGLYCVAVMLIALAAARGAGQTTRQRVCAASLPARTM